MDRLDLLEGRFVDHERHQTNPWVILVEGGLFVRCGGFGCVVGPSLVFKQHGPHRPRTGQEDGCTGLK